MLAGKITPKGETTMTPEEKLLRAIFGEKAGRARHLAACRPGVSGTVVDVRVFNRHGIQRTKAAPRSIARRSSAYRLDPNDQIASSGRRV